MANIWHVFDMNENITKKFVNEINANYGNSYSFKMPHTYIHMHLNHRYPSCLISAAVVSRGLITDSTYSSRIRRSITYVYTVYQVNLNNRVQSVTGGA